MRHTTTHFDWVLFGAIFFITAFGAAAIFSLEWSVGQKADSFLIRQLIAWGLGIFACILITRFQSSLFEWLSASLYIFSLALLVAVLFFGETIRGTQGWFQFSGVSFQPVEFAKVVLIIHCAHFLSKNRDHFRTWWPLLGSAVIVGIPVFLTLLQPDAGSALIMCMIWFVMVVISGIRRVHVAVFGVCISIFAVLSWVFLLADYQKDRLRTFFDPGGEPLGRGYNVSQSIIAVGSGGMWGKGLGYGSQSHLRFLPEAHTDFIFAVIAEELGFFGVIILLALSGVAWMRIIRIASHATNDFGVFLAFGFLTFFVIQTMINIGMNVGIVPVTGIVLPFVSFGGSALLMSYICVGLCVRIGIESRQKSVMIIE